ncbi:MAG: hypothetical protein DRQ88_09505 [Epsilonproteobacteria bacterium]|nr:MAG: hypothetical protein DRQ88_09505 [Campylobacterota bacterium]
MGDKVSFVPKTLPGETGEAELLSEKKGVRFLRSTSLEKTSSERIEAVCPHFKECPSCHFLHTSYENELKFKADSLKRTLKTEKEIIVHPAPERLGYRNRIQLHYNKVTQKLGYLDALKNTIIEVPNCMIGAGPILDYLKDLYQEKKWFDLVKREPKTGHIEISFHEELISVQVNKAYAHGGFTQVYEEMNQKLKTILRDKISGTKILDLFGGNGNLTQELTDCEVLVVDISPAPKNLKDHQNYFRINLKNKLLLKQDNFDVVIIDPPRAGFKDIDTFFETVKCNDLFYVSCNPSTLKRDLVKLSRTFNIQEIHLLDFFPSTYHFETLVHLSKQ